MEGSPLIRMIGGFLFFVKPKCRGRKRDRAVSILFQSGFDSREFLWVQVGDRIDAKVKQFALKLLTTNQR